MALRVLRVCVGRGEERLALQSQALSVGGSCNTHLSTQRKQSRCMLVGENPAPVQQVPAWSALEAGSVQQPTPFFHLFFSTVGFGWLASRPDHEWRKLISAKVRMGAGRTWGHAWGACSRCQPPLDCRQQRCEAAAALHSAVNFVRSAATSLMFLHPPQ